MGLSDMSETLAPIIELHNITKQFPGVLALDDVSLSIYPGQVHAVLGENGAGKSTLMNILAGEIQPTSGHIIYDGQQREIPNPFVSQQLGISVVYQELALCTNLTIAENISLGSASSRFALTFVRRNEFRRRAQQALERLGMSNINVNRQVRELSVAQQQMVEIAKAISLDARVLILDEPNSALTGEETEHLFRVLDQLRAEGVAIIYVSHRLEEVVQIADRITVLRDGRFIDTLTNTPDLTIEDLITRMVGRAVDRFFQREVQHSARPDVALSVRGLAAKNDTVHDISFELKKGEVLGVAGLPDSGKDELVSCIFGLQPYEGHIEIGGQALQVRSPATAIEHGMVLIPADRRGSGAILVMNVEDNTVVSSLKQVSQAGFMNRRASREMGEEFVRQLDTRISSLKQRMATLSGGNQQKVILGRGLATEPEVLVLHEPTRGIDVGAKVEIYQILQRLAQDGVGILIVSSELPELISQCDRVIALHHGRVTGIFTTDDASEESILACIMGQATHFVDRAAQTSQA